MPFLMASFSAGNQTRPIPSDGALYSLVTSYSGSRRPRGHSRANVPRAALTPRDRETCPGNSIWAVDPRQIPYASHAHPTAAATSVRSLALYKARCSSIPYLTSLPLASHRHSTYIPDIPPESPTLPCLSPTFLLADTGYLRYSKAQLQKRHKYIIHATTI